MAAYITFQPSDHYKTQLYTATGSALTTTGVGFSADWTWIKDRDATKWHNLVDTINGYNKYVYTNSTLPEDTVTDRLTSWNSDGFVLGTNTETNNGTDDYASYNWKAGTTTGIATNGSTTITPSDYSFNQTTGISFVKFTANGSAGAKVAHGLGVAPSCFFLKVRDENAGYPMYHKNMRYPNGPAEDFYIMIQSTAADGDQVTYWNDTAPDSVNFTLGTNTDVNKSGATYLGYCFAEKPGFSKFGVYTGNGNANGTFVYTGFQPSYLMIKTCNNAGQNWNIYDVGRHPYNSTVNNYFEANSDIADGTATAMNVDFLSNGFKPRGSNAGMNGSTYNYIFLAFAEFPLVSSNDVPGVAF